MTSSSSRSLVFSLLTLIVTQLFVTTTTLADNNAHVLIYTMTAGFRHDSIPTAVESLRTEGSSIKVQFDNTEDMAAFNDANLKNYDAVMFLSTTGDVLDTNGLNAFSKYLKMGGNFIGVHSASATLYNATFYGLALGAYFQYHPELQNATVDVINNSYPFTKNLPAQWKVQDEMYNFVSDPRQHGAVVVLAANESSYVDTGPRGDQGSPHPLAWCQTSSEAVAGRSFYSSLGHLTETWKDKQFLSHILGGVQWVLDGNTTLARNSSALVGNPVKLQVTTSSEPNSKPTSVANMSSPSFTSMFSIMFDVVGALVVGWIGHALLF